LFAVENLDVPFDPNDPKCNAPRKVPNFDHFTVFLRILSPNKTCFQFKLS
jgi:hypothetical protein